MQLFATLSTVALTLPAVSAHGYVQWGLFGNTNETGYNFNTDPYTSPAPQRVFRKIPGNGPVTDLSLIDVQCNGYTDGGFATAPAPRSVSIAAGGKVSLEWSQWPDSHKGPLITYLAKCPGSCSSYSPTKNDKVWFKIAAAGKDANQGWASTPLESNPAALYTFTIPSTLAAGNYILRHEIIALHAAYSYPGAQVYPSCAQITVTGSGTKSPAASYLVAFPGAYTADTPGIVYNMYTNTSAYPIPGPALWTG